MASFIMGTTQMFCLNDYLRDLQEVVDVDCGSSNCAGVTRAAEIMKRRFDAIGFAAELVDLGSQVGRGLFAVNRTAAGVPFLQVGEECGAGQGRTPDNAEDHFVSVWRNNDP